MVQVGSQKYKESMKFLFSYLVCSQILLNLHLSYSRFYYITNKVCFFLANFHTVVTKKKGGATGTQGFFLAKMGPSRHT